MGDKPADADPPTESPRPCGSCGAMLAAERFSGEEGVTWVWRCACGWGSALTDPTDQPRRSRAHDAILRALNRLGQLE